MSTVPATRASAPPRLAVIYDGTCRFCIASSKRLEQLARPGALERVPSDDPALAQRFPGITREAADRAMQVITPDGRVYSGAAAVVAALNTRPAWRAVTWLYFVPGLKQLADALYRLVARYRYRLMGKADPCDTGTCQLP